MFKRNRLVVLLGFLLVVPFIGTMYMQIAQKNEDIMTSELEIVGLKYHTALFELMLTAQDYRGTNNLAGNSKSPDKIKQNLTTLESVLLENIKKVDAQDIIFGKQLKSSGRWHTTRQSFMESFIHAPFGTTLEVFEKQTATLILLADFMDEVSTTSKLVLEPELEPYYMMIIITQALPNISKNISYIRGKASGHLLNGPIQDSIKMDLIERYGQVREALKIYQYATSVLAENDPERIASEIESEAGIIPSLHHVLQLLHHIDNGKSVSHEQFYDAATATITALSKAHKAMNTHLEWHINTRILAMEWSRISIIASTSLLSIATVYLFLYMIKYSVKRQELDSARQLQALHAAIKKAQAVVEFNPNGTVVTANDNFLIITGYTLPEIQGQHHSIFIEPLKKDSQNYQQFWKNLRHGEPQEGEYPSIRKDGKEIWLHGNYSPLLDQDQKVYKIILLATDTTRRKQAEIASQAKSDFLSNMSHELRTPLNSILGMTQLLETQALPHIAKDMLRDIKQSGENLLGIVNDILDLSKIEANMVQLEYYGFDICDKSRSFVNTMLPVASRKGLWLKFTTDNNLLYVKGDALRFVRILANLISNAIRFTEKGGIDVVFSTKPGQDSTVALRGEVRDTGLGIPPDIQDKIFKKFVQADGSTTRKHGGTGLGLAITKELVEMMGGRIGVLSEPGKGSTFWFEITFETCAALEAAEESDGEDISAQKSGISIRDARVLIVEDHNMNQRFIQRLFESMGAKHFKIVDNGVSAVKEASTGTYDLILMDCHLPEMSGFDATTAIRKLSDPACSQVPIVAMTANVMSGDEDACLKVGMNAYISKPIDIRKFKSTLRKWINFNTTDSTASGAPILSDAAINLDGLIENCMGDDAFLKEMCALFVKQGAEQITQLGPLCIDGNNHDWVEVSHALKGTAGHIGAEKMRELCGQAQLMETANAAARKEQLAAIEVEYLKAVSYLIQKQLYAAT